jgi:hypothetical protein
MLDVAILDIEIEQDLDRLLTERDLKQVTVSSKLGVDGSIVSLWCRRKRNVPLYRIPRVREILEETPVVRVIPSTLPRQLLRPIVPPPALNPVVVQPLAAPRQRPVAQVEAAGTCLDDCCCPRWYCRSCGQYWTGSNAHTCGEATCP